MTDAELLWKIVMLAAVLANLAVMIKKFYGVEKRTLTNSPLEIRQTEDAVSRREHSAALAHLEVRVGGLERRMDGHMAQVREEVADLHEKVNANHAEVIRALGRLEGTYIRP